jgi:hypothetical protein
MNLGSAGFDSLRHQTKAKVPPETTARAGVSACVQDPKQLEV